MGRGARRRFRQRGWLALGLVGALLLTPAAMAQEPLQFGFHLTTGGNRNAQIWQVLKVATEVFGRTKGHAVTPVYVQDHHAYRRALEEKKYAVAVSMIVTGVLRPGYERLRTVTVYNKAAFEDCLYVKKKSPFQSLDDLSGKRVATMAMDVPYESLRHMVGGPPEDKFFLIGAGGGESLFIALSLDQVEAVHAIDVAYEHLKKTNPGPVKNLRKVACGKMLRPAPALLVRKDLPDTFKKDITQFLAGVMKNKAMRQYHPLLRVAGLKFVPVDGPAYDTVGDLHRRAEKEGWHKDYEQWVAALKKKSRQP